LGHLGEDGPEMMEQYLFQKGNKVFARSTLCDDDNEIILQYIYRCPAVPPVSEVYA
jgi:hypothetical protein